MIIAASCLLVLGLTIAVLRAAITDTVTLTWASGSDSVTVAQIFTDDTRLYGDYPINTGVTNQEITFATTQAALGFLMFAVVGTAGLNLTIKTNNSGAPDDTFTVSSDNPYYLRDGTLLTADITKLYVTNASGATLTLKIRGLKDGTV